MRISDWSSDVCSSDLPLERKRISEDANSCRSRTVCAMILVKLLTIGYQATVRLALAFFVTMAVFLSGIHSGPAEAHENDPVHTTTHHVAQQDDGPTQPTHADQHRSAKPRVGKACGGTSRSRRWPCHDNTKKNN